MIYTSDFSAMVDKDMKVCVGDTDVRLEVNASSSLPLKYTWSKSGVVTTTSDISKINGSYVDIANITSDMVAKVDSEGKLIDNYYMCTVTSIFNTISKASTDSVIFKVASI